MHDRLVQSDWSNPDAARRESQHRKYQRRRYRHSTTRKIFPSRKEEEATMIVWGNDPMYVSKIENSIV